MKTYLEILELSSRLPKYFCPLNCIAVANSYTQHPLSKMTPHAAQFQAHRRRRRKFPCPIFRPRFRLC